MTFADGSVLRLTGYTDAAGRAGAALPVTAVTPKGTVHVSARTQAASVIRTSMTSWRRD
jgi:hypothetical protein